MNYKPTSNISSYQEKVIKGRPRHPWPGPVTCSETRSLLRVCKRMCVSFLCGSTSEPGLGCSWKRALLRRSTVCAGPRSHGRGVVEELAQGQGCRGSGIGLGLPGGRASASGCRGLGLGRSDTDPGCPFRLPGTGDSQLPLPSASGHQGGQDRARFQPRTSQAVHTPLLFFPLELSLQWLLCRR